MLRAQLPSGILVTLEGIQKWTGLGFVLLTDLDPYFDILTQSHDSILINKTQVNVPKDKVRYLTLTATVPPLKV